MTTSRRVPGSVEPVSAWRLQEAQQQNASKRPPVALLQQWKLPPGTLTELAGPAGAGKTQLAWTLCVDQLLLNQQALYLHTHRTPPIQRISQMLQARTNSSSQKWLDHLFLRWVPTLEELTHLVEDALPRLKASLGSNNNISLIVLDDMAELLRVPEETPSQNYHVQRAQALFVLSSRLKQLAQEWQVAIVLLNQATTDYGVTGDQSRLKPALGLAWSQSVHATLWVDRCLGKTYQPLGTNMALTRRQVLCSRAPWIPSQECLYFYLDQRGTVRIENPT